MANSIVDINNLNLTSGFRYLRLRLMPTVVFPITNELKPSEKNNEARITSEDKYAYSPYSFFDNTRTTTSAKRIKSPCLIAPK